MESFTLTAIAVFLAPYFHKAGEKIAEKTIESVFQKQENLAEKFKGLFKHELTTLDLIQSTTPEEIIKQLEKSPDLKIQIQKKIVDHQDLIDKLAEALSKQEGRGINCKTYVKNIENIEIANFN